MAEKIVTKYDEHDFLDLMEGLSGATTAFENRTDEYIDALNEYINDEIGSYSLENSINNIVGSLEILYDSLDPLDELIEEERMVAQIKQGDRRGICILDESIKELSRGIYSEVESFHDVITLFHYMEESDIDADERYLVPEVETNAPTRMVAEKEQLLDIDDRINRQYERIAEHEVLARQNTESDNLMQTYSPEPPIFRMLGHEDHAERIKRLNKAFKKR